MTGAALVALINELITLEPAAVGLVSSLIKGLQGKSDSEILSADAQAWAGIIVAAHGAAQPPKP